MAIRKQLQQIEMAVLEDQVVDHILDQAAVEVVSTSYQDALTGAAIAPPETDDDGAAEAESAAQGTDADTAPGEAADKAAT